MKILKLEITTLLIIIALSVNVTATGFSPSSLTFNLNPNQEDCKTITIDSESETITISDNWAENKDIEWKVSLFNKSAEYHGISINYDNELSLDERQAEVCLSGNQIGEYHGVLLLREEQQGNSIIQMGVWLKVIIAETQQNNNVGGGGGSSGSGSTSTSTINTTTDSSLLSTQSTIPATTTQENNNQDEKTNSGITGSVIGLGSPVGKIVWGFVLLIAIVWIFVYYKRRSENEKYE